MCFGDVRGRDAAELKCGHVVCRDCAGHLATLNVRDGSLQLLTCPEPSCRSELTPGLLQQLLTPELYERFERLSLERALASMSDLLYCPRCNTAAVEDAQHCAMCAKCAFVFCGLCVEAWHPGRTCLTADARVEMLKARAAGPLSSAELQKRTQQLVADALSMQAIRQNHKRCPVRTRQEADPPAKRWVTMIMRFAARARRRAARRWISLRGVTRCCARAGARSAGSAGSRSSTATTTLVRPRARCSTRRPSPRGSGRWAPAACGR